MSVFSFEVGLYDSQAPEDVGKNIVLRTPQLGLYSSAEVAAKALIGLSILEGDLNFFGADGSPLAANFSEYPVIPNPDGKTFFPGIYTLQAGTGDNLLSSLRERIAANETPHARIVVFMPTSDDAATSWGWKNAHEMKAATTKALEILPPELAQRITFEERTWGSDFNRPTASIFRRFLNWIKAG